MLIRCLLVLALVSHTLILIAQNETDYYNKAYAQLQYQNYQEAHALVCKALELKPDYADAHALRGDCNYYMEAYDKAIADYEKDDTYKKSRGSYSLACTYALAGNIDKAFKALEANLNSEYKVAMSAIIGDKDLETYIKHLK